MGSGKDSKACLSGRSKPSPFKFSLGKNPRKPPKIMLFIMLPVLEALILFGWAIYSIGGR